MQLEYESVHQKLLQVAFCINAFIVVHVNLVEESHPKDVLKAGDGMDCGVVRLQEARKWVM